MTPVLVIKLLRDLRTIWPRILLMVLATSVTVIMFSAVLYTWAVTSREIPRAYLGTSPASATVLLEARRDADQMAAFADALRTHPGMIDAAVRTQFTLQVQQDGGGWGPNPFQIFVIAPHDPLQIERFTVQSGSWPPAAGGMLVDRSSLELFHLAVGDDVVVQAPNGRAARLRIAGVVYYPALAPSFQEQKGHGFVSAASLPVLGEPVAFDAIKVRIADASDHGVASRDRDHIVATVRTLGEWLQRSYGVSIREVQVPTPYAHPHQGQVDSLLLGLLAFGIAGLLLSAVLVATMLNGLLSQHVPQIGIMKAIGAKSGRVLQFYILMTLLIGTVATTVALAPGIWISRTFAPTILSLLGFEAESHSAPRWTYAVVVTAGVGVPLMIALATLVKASRITVREALDYRGVGRAGAATRFDAGLSRWLQLDRLTLLAVSNAFRRRARFALSVGLLAAAGAVFVAGMSTIAGFQARLERDQNLRRWDVEVSLAEDAHVSPVDLQRLIAQVPAVSHVEMWGVTQTSVIPPGERLSVTRTYPDEGHGSVSVTVVPHETTLLTVPTISEGRWLGPNETGAVVISRTALTDPVRSVRAGDDIQLAIDGRFSTWQVVGLSDASHGGGIFMTRDGFTAATGSSTPNLLRIVTRNHDEGTRSDAAQQVDRVLTTAGLSVRSAASVSRSAAAGAGHMLPLILVFLGLSIGIAVVGFAGLASTMSANVLERTREIGVMRAIGASSSTVRRIVILEGVFVALVGCVAAAVPAVTLSIVLSRTLPFGGPFQISVPGVAIWVVVVLAGTAVATAAPARRASRVTVREALNYL